MAATSREHSYRVLVTWTGNRGSGTSGYTTYDRTHEISAPGKPVIPASSDPDFRGDGCPSVTIASGDEAVAEALHERAHALCFIANSVNFPVRCEPRVYRVESTN